MLRGRPLRVEWIEDLERHLGKPVHAASDIPRRRILLDGALRGGELRRIFVHEVFHFAWVRLGNRRREEWAAHLASEYQARARGELGWSAEVRKQRLTAPHGRKWREYVCESFCDTAAWLYAGVRDHAEWTLAHRHRKRRAAWMARIIEEMGELRV